MIENEEWSPKLIATFTWVKKKTFRASFKRKDWSNGNVYAKKIFMHVVKLQHSSVAFYVENSRKREKKMNSELMTMLTLN